MSCKDKAEWQFPKLGGGSIQGYTDSSVQSHKGKKLIENIAREICQNSIDAKNPKLGDDVPVKVVFSVKSVNPSKFNVFSGYQKCIKSCRNYWGDRADPRLAEALALAEEELSKEKISVLTISDYNTTGLFGVKNSDRSLGWSVLTSSEGVSSKSSKTSGGSYGVGKDAAYAGSSLNMVFYNTLNLEGESAFMGVAKLATMLDKDKEETQRVGRWRIYSENTSRPVYPEDHDSFRNFIAKRTEPGTDIIIPGFAGENGWEEKVRDAVLSSFFVAISEGVLEVEISSKKSCCINKNTLPVLMEEARKNKFMWKACDTYEAFSNPEKIGKFQVFEKDDLWVYAKTDPKYRCFYIGMRLGGMQIVHGKYSLPIHYSAVIIAKGNILSQILRETEPTAHNDWDQDNLRQGTEKYKMAEKALSAINTYFHEFVEGFSAGNISDSINAYGLGAYLPFGTGAQEGDFGNVDALIPRFEIGEASQIGLAGGGTSVRGRRTKKDSKDLAFSATGTNMKARIGDKPRMPKSKYQTTENAKSSRGPSFGKERDENTEIIESRFSENEFIKNNVSYRTSPINGKNLHRLVIVPKEDIKTLYIEYFTLMDSNKTEPASIKKMMVNGQDVRRRGYKFGPISVNKDEKTDVYVTLSNGEEAVYLVRLSEEENG